MKGYSELRGIDKLRTMHTTKQRSIPRAQRSVEIELYLLQKERERFMKEAHRIIKRYEAVVERVKTIDEEIERQEKVKVQIQDRSQLPVLRPAHEVSGEWKTKKMNY